MRLGHALERVRRSPVALIPTVFLLQVFFWVSIQFQIRSWHEDTGPRLRRTSEWLPGRTYAPEIEAALRLLQCSDAGKGSYLRSRGVPIHVLTPAVMAASGCPAGSLGCTRKANSSINVLSRTVNQPAALAAVLSHEITHVMTHDPDDPPPTRSVLRRIFGRNEEATAHVAGIRTAKALHVPQWGGVLGGWALEYLVWYWPFGTLLYTVLFSILGLRRLYLEVGRFAIEQGAKRTARATHATTKL